MPFETRLRQAQPLLRANGSFERAGGAIRRPFSSHSVGVVLAAGRAFSSSLISRSRTTSAGSAAGSATPAAFSRSAAAITRLTARTSRKTMKARMTKLMTTVTN